MPKISQLTAATSLSTADLVPVVDGGSTKQATLAQIAAICVGTGVCTLEQFQPTAGTGNAATDQLAWNAAQAAIAAGTYSTLQLGAATYSGTAAPYYTPPAGSSVLGQGNGTKIATTLNSIVFSVVNTKVALRNFRISGNSAGTSQIGIGCGVSAGATMPADVVIDNVYAENLGVAFDFVNGNSALFNGPTVTDCTATSCTYGFRFTAQAEYVQLANCEAVTCTYGAYVACGNIVWAGGSLENGTYGAYLAAGSNDGHGIFSGTQINHNASPVYAGAIVNGHTFVGCHLYGGQLWLNGSNGVTFRSCTLRPDVGGTQEMLFNSATATQFVDCIFTTAGHPTVSIDSASEVYFINCRDLSSPPLIPSGIAPFVRKAYTFPSDADQTLSKQDSAAEAIIVAAGTITGYRTLTSARPPVSGYRTLIRNNNAQPIAFKWSSGTGVNIPSLSAVWVGSDGTNATREMTELASLDSGANLLVGDTQIVANVYSRCAVGGHQYCRIGAQDVFDASASVFGLIVALGGASAYNAQLSLLPVAITVSGSVTATAAQYASPLMRLTGTGGTLILPAGSGVVFIQNGCTSAVTVKTAAGTGVSVAAGGAKILVGTGTDYALANV